MEIVILIKLAIIIKEKLVLFDLNMYSFKKNEMNLKMIKHR